LDCNKTVKLFFHEKSDEDEVYWSTGSSVLSFKDNGDANKSCEVEGVNLVEFIQNLNRDDAIVKIDVEGAEYPIINKIIDAGLHHHIGVILVETHDDKIPELKKETDVLRQRVAELGLDNIILDWT
jgi:FkbM family methyltransferase